MRMRLFCTTVATLALTSALHPFQVQALPRNDRFDRPLFVERAEPPNTVNWRGRTKIFFGQTILAKHERRDPAGSELIVVTDIAVYFIKEGNNDLLIKTVYHGLSEISPDIYIEARAIFLTASKDGVIAAWRISNSGGITRVQDASED